MIALTALSFACIVVYVLRYPLKSTSDEYASMKRTFHYRLLQIYEMKTPEQFASLEKLIDADADRFRSKMDPKIVNMKVGYLKAVIACRTDELYGIPHTDAHWYDYTPAQVG